MATKQMTMVSRQTIDGETGEQTVRALVAYSVHEHGVVMTYAETGDLEGTASTLVIKDGEVTLTRNGTTRTTMTFVRGKRCDFSYETAAGLLSMSVVTAALDSTLGENGGRLTLRYLLYAGGGLLSKNEMIIDVT